MIYISVRATRYNNSSPLFHLSISGHRRCAKTVAAPRARREEELAVSRRTRAEFTRSSSVHALYLPRLINIVAYYLCGTACLARAYSGTRSCRDRVVPADEINNLRKCHTRLPRKCTQKLREIKYRSAEACKLILITARDLSTAEMRSKKRTETWLLPVD